MIFKNWLDTPPKMETHDPTVYPTILGGVSQGFWSPFLDWGARSAIFVLRAVSGPFHPLYETKISNRPLSVVYGSITLKFFLGALGISPHQWFNRGNKIQKKKKLGRHLPYQVQKCPFSSANKWHFERPDLKTESKNLAKHPPKWLGRHLGHAFPFSGEYQANF